MGVEGRENEVGEVEEKDEKGEGKGNGEKEENIRCKNSATGRLRRQKLASKTKISVILLAHRWPSLL